MRFKQARAKAVMNIMQSGLGKTHPKAALAATTPFRHPYLLAGAAGATMLGRKFSRDPGTRFANGRSAGRVNYHGSSSAVSGLTGKSSGGFTG